MRSAGLLLANTAALLLGVLPLVAGQHEAEHMDIGEVSVTAATTVTSAEPFPNYFRHAHHAPWIYAHVALMIAAWAVVMPVAIMLSVARSRYHISAQLLFHVFNGVGVFTGFVYNHATPDLYVTNSHHPIGWVVTSFAIVWTVLSLFVAYGEYKSKRQEATSSHNFRRFGGFQQYRDNDSGRSSRDSGQGTERNSASLLGSRQGSQDSFKEVEIEAPMSHHDYTDEDDTRSEKHGLLGDNKVDRFVSRSVRRLATPGASKIVRFIQIVMEKFLLLLGFLAITTGFVVLGGVFMKREIFSGLAHFIKGGIFFWYGLLTLGRWMGAFSEFGWAWNLRPSQPLVSRWKTRVPSAEFVESFVIWLYGASNVFLEHLNNWGQEWSPQDLEHVSITLLFFGGGLLGMVIESPWARELMNTNVQVQKDKEGEVGGTPSHYRASVHGPSAADDDLVWNQPKTYKTSLNPMPGLVIMLLGIMMSSHHQTSMVSTMMHSQWGTLFVGFAMARAATYIISYLKPPTSHYPARPPSELIASFCLVAGGLMFMMSARDVVTSIENNGLDAMAIFTVTMGLTGLIMAWEVLVYTLKGWAVRKERTTAGRL